MSEELKANLKNTATWKRVLYMLVFVVIFHIAEIVLGIVVVFQVLASLLSGQRNQRLLVFGAQLGTYFVQIIRYLTYNSDDLPYPFAEWPAGEGGPKAHLEQDAPSTD
jgi:hypothetical protein